MPEIDQTSLFFNTPNSSFRLVGLVTGLLGTSLYTNKVATSASTATMAIHSRQLTYCPTRVAMGTPTIVAMVNPENTKDI